MTSGRLGRGCSDTQLLVEPTEGIADDVELVPELLHHAVDAGSVFQDVHALGVWVVPYREGTLDGLGKLPVHTANCGMSYASLCSTLKKNREPNSPHLYFGLLKTVRHKVDVLKRCDDAFLFGCNLGVEGRDPCIAGESMLSKRQNGSGCMLVGAADSI